MSKLLVAGGQSQLLGGRGGAAASPIPTANLALWLKADALALNDGDAVSAWADSSGNGRDATESGANRPTYKASIINGRPIIRFGGTHRLLIPAAVLTLSHTLYIVYKPTLEASVGYTLMQWASGQTGRFTLTTNQNSLGTAQSGKLTLFNASNTDGAGIGGVMEMGTITANPTLVTSVHTTGSEKWKWFLNNTLVDSATITAIYTGINTTIGALNPSTTGNLKADLAEIIVYSAAHDDTTRQGVQGYLATKYGITLA